MAQRPDSFNRRRLRSSYASVVVSISLVLFLLGVLGLLLLNAGQVAQMVKESFAVQVILNDDIPELDRMTMQKELSLTGFVKSVRFVPKEEAAKELKSQLEEDFVEFLGYNPLQDAFDLRLNADYVTPAQLVLIERDLDALEYVDDVIYDKPLLELMSENIRRVGIGLLFGSALLLLISIALINSSIRLAIYSRRFLIKTMQLVGATHGFIRRPFLRRGFIHGILGSIVASSLLAVLIYLLFDQLPDLKEILQPAHYFITFGALLISGVFISWICTYFAVRRYLSLKTDQLYY
jgi:cell division transport system permease protein